MKEVLVTVVVCLSILGISLGFFYGGETHRRNADRSLSCGECADGMKRKKSECACETPPVAREKVDVNEIKKFVPKKKKRRKETIIDKIRDASKRTGCPKKLDFDYADSLKSRDGFGAGDLFDLCEDARRGKRSAIKQCGLPSGPCSMSVVKVGFDHVKNEYDYKKEENKTIYPPSYGTFQSFDEAKNYCDRVLECEGVVYDADTRVFSARGGEEAEDDDDVAWVRGDFI